MGGYCWNKRLFFATTLLAWTAIGVSLTPISLAQQAELPIPPKRNAYEALNNRGLWDGNGIEADSGLSWELLDKGNKEGKSGNKPETPKFLQPTFQELHARFNQIEAAEQARIIHPQDDPTHAVVVVTQPMVDGRGRHLGLGLYSVALRQGNSQPPQSIAELTNTPSSHRLAITGQVSAIDNAQAHKPNTAAQRLLYPHNDVTWQTQANPFNLTNPRKPTPDQKTIKIIESNGETTKVSQANSTGWYLVVKRQGVVKGIFPVVNQQPYQRQRNQRKGKPAFAVTGAQNNQPVIGLTVGKTTYIGQGQLDTPPIVAPTLSSQPMNQSYWY